MSQVRLRAAAQACCAPLLPAPAHQVLRLRDAAHAANSGVGPHDTEIQAWGAACAGGQALALLLSKEGEFVYSILIEELAKGLDAGWRLATDAAIANARQRALTALGVWSPPTVVLL